MSISGPPPQGHRKGSIPHRSGIRVSLPSPPMKGSRLHRPEPQAHLVASAAAAPTPAPAPADDWVDGSWTVDCSCGVTFDDGEEMVSCDECNVWVHTRCARYVRGVHTSFSCHNCRSKRATSSADEAEVAELLAELPTHRPPPLYRRWSEVPLPARVHVHGLPGGGEGALFRGAPSYTAALWRCTGYVPKRFGFRYCEFPSWADDKDGADALFALAREKRREMADPRSSAPIAAKPKMEKHYVRSLSCLGKKNEDSPLTEAKKRESDTWKDGCQQIGVRAADAGTNSVNKTKKVMEESLELSGNKKSPMVIPRRLNKDEDSVKLEASNGARIASPVAEQEVHSGFARVEVAMCKQQAEGNNNIGLTCDTLSSGPKKMESIQGVQLHSNQISFIVSPKMKVGPEPDLKNVQSKSQIIKTEPSSGENGIADGIQVVSDDCKGDKQGLGDTAGSSIIQKNSSKSKYASACSEHPKSETEKPTHTVGENPISLSRASSGGIIDRLTRKKLVSPDRKHDSPKLSPESSQEVKRCSEKVQLKDSLTSAPKSSQASRIYMSAGKTRLPVSKEQSQKTATTGGTSARSLDGEVPVLQSRNKAAPSSSSQKKEKIHQRIIQVTQEGSNNSSSELRASDSTAPLSDEQLALLLHQQLNSSPRVPRVPRCHQAAGTQMLHPTGFFSRRSSAHGGKDHVTVLKKRNREDTLKDNEDSKRIEKVSFIERRHRNSSAEHVPSLKDSCRQAENIASEQRNRGICSTGSNTGLAMDDSMDSSISSRLPGLIEEIISKSRTITYEDLCDAIHQHFRDLRKPNGEEYTYSSYLHAINNCLRKRTEWSHLVEQAAKMNTNKRRKGESSSLLSDVLGAPNRRNGPERDSEEQSAELHQDDPSRGKRKARKRRRLELKGRRVRDIRKRASIDSSSEDAAAILSDSNSDRNDTSMGDHNQEDNSFAPRTGGYMEVKSADSSS